MSRRRGWLGGCLSALALLCCVVLIGFAFRTQVLIGLGSFLVRNEPPEKADVIVALAGDDFGERVFTAGELVYLGYAPYALISGNPYLLTNGADETIAYAEACGFPRSYFQPFRCDAVSTLDETQDIARELKRRRIHKILLVTSNYHTRRAGLLMKKAAPWLEIHTVAAPDRYFTPDDWWKNRGGQRTFLFEWMKTVSTWLGN
jgi:uncharacterized SAM-binding protein YcdF (DUF218 family)